MHVIMSTAPNLDWSFCKTMRMGIGMGLEADTKIAKAIVHTVTPNNEYTSIMLVGCYFISRKILSGKGLVYSVC